VGVQKEQPVAPWLTLPVEASAHILYLSFCSPPHCRTVRTVPYCIPRSWFLTFGACSSTPPCFRENSYSPASMGPWDSAPLLGTAPVLVFAFEACISYKDARIVPCCLCALCFLFQACVLSQGKYSHVGQALNRFDSVPSSLCLH